jgi:hypothetical protein
MELLTFKINYIIIYIVNKMFNIDEPKKKYRCRYTDEERIIKHKEAQTRACLKYQRGNPKYLAYKRMLWKRNTYKKIKYYLDKHTNINIDDFVNMEDYTSREMKKKFKKKFGQKIYERYVQ